MYRKKGVRFSAEKQERWRAKGRGTGTGPDYQPWHQVTRGDPASLGSSYVINADQFPRQLHLLSDAERLGLMCVVRLKQVTQIREQYPLNQDYEWGEQGSQRSLHQIAPLPGTTTIANLLGYRHPQVPSEKGGEAGLWQMTTDILTDLKTGGSETKQLALSIKRETHSTKRTQEKMAIEAKYWECRGVPFHVINFAHLGKREIVSIQCMESHVLESYKIPSKDMDLVGETLNQETPYEVNHALNLIGETLRIADLLWCQCALWQAVWTGRYPIVLDDSIPRGKLVRADIDDWCNWDPLKGAFQWR